MLLLVVCVAMVNGVHSASDVSTIVNCASCKYVSWPRDAWECDVRCNVAPTGVLTYGEILLLLIKTSKQMKKLSIFPVYTL